MTSAGATVLVVGLGDLGTRVFNALTQSASIERLIGGSRNQESGTATASQAALAADLAGGPRHVTFERLDLDCVEETAQQLSLLHPDIVVMAASRHTWWRPSGTKAEQRQMLARLPYTVWLPLHLAPVRRLMEARQLSGTRGRVACLPFPDVVGPALRPLGLQPDIGAGNVTEVAAKLRLLAARSHNVPREDVQVRLVMHHAAERDAFAAFTSLVGGNQPEETPPWLGEVRVRNVLLPPEQVNALFRSAYPLPTGRDSQSLTAAATIHLIDALLSDSPVQTHAPAPHGFPGGYPVVVSRDTIELDLPSNATVEGAIDINNRAAQWDGIESIHADGTIIFTQGVGDLTEEILGLRLQRLVPADLNEVADEIEQRAARID